MKKDEKFETVFLCCLLALVVFFWIFSSFKESEAYNRLTGAHTTTADAMFIELRVMEGTKK